MQRTAHLRAVHVAGAALAASAVAGGVWWLRAFDPNQAGSPFLPCLFNAFTGLYCPGCGATRALHALVHFDLPAALGMNALLVLLIPLMPMLVLWSRGWRPAAIAPLMRIVEKPVTWLVVIPAFALVRNLPWLPFAWLAPG